jgi:ADP-heptose:LPS heptosyltransferase
MGRKTIRVITWGGIGDVLLSTPALRAIKNKYPESNLIVYCKSKTHYDVLARNPSINRLRRTSLFFYISAYILSKFRSTKIFKGSYGHLYPSICYNINATKIIAEMFDVKLLQSKIEIFLTKRENQNAREKIALYKNPIILHITSLTSKNQEWALKNWEELLIKLPEYTFIQIGLSTEVLVNGAIDFRGKTSIREAFALIKNSKSFVGVVSSFSHATNAFDTPGVILFGPSTPIVWGHQNNINIYKYQTCSPCIDLLANHDCPYNKTCMNNITVEEVKSALLSQLEIMDKSYKY